MATQVELMEETWTKRGWSKLPNGQWKNPDGKVYLLNYKSGAMELAENWGDKQTTIPLTKDADEMRDAPKAPDKDAFEGLRALAEGDVVEIFGDTGTGKSWIAATIALSAKQNNKKVYYFDTERNLPRTVVSRLGQDSYKYNPRFRDLLKLTENPDQMPKADLFVLDSIGFPVLVNYARMNLKSRGEALLQEIAILGSLKEWCYINGSTALIINQPTSEMGLEPDEEPHPFGQKAAFATKVILKTVFDKLSGTGKLISWRARDLPYGHVVATYAIKQDGVDIKWTVA